MQYLKEIKVLDHGYIRLIEYMGNDDKVIWAARRSTEGSGRRKNNDEYLIDYLIRNGHHSPMEHCMVTFEMKMPMMAFNQLIRHRTGHPSVLSMRYSGNADLDFYTPTVNRIIDAGVHHSQAFDYPDTFGNVAQSLYECYRDDIKNGMASELARANLPESRYTNVAFTIDLRNLLHLLKERTAMAAQYEIRVYADIMLSITRTLFPRTVGAWENHIKHAISFSRDEIDMLVANGLKAVATKATSAMDERKARILMDKIKHL